MPWGDTPTRQGPFVVDARTAAILPGRQLSARFDRVVIDKSHKTAFKEEKDIDPSDILAYGTPEIVEGEGVVLTAIRWTPEGQKLWAQYEDISPAVRQQKETGVVTFLDSVALCVRGEVERLTMFSADSTAGVYLQPTEDVMKELLIQYMKLAGVTVADDASDEQIQAIGVKGLETRPAPEEGNPSALSADADNRIKALEKGEARREKAEIKRQASAAGKIIHFTDAEIDEMPVTLFASHVAQLPAGKVPVHGATTPAKDEREAELTAADRDVAAKMGLSEEEFKKYGAPPAKA